MWWAQKDEGHEASWIKLKLKLLSEDEDEDGDDDKSDDQASTSSYDIDEEIIKLIEKVVKNISKSNV